jgi:hypothetical protein
VRSKDSFVNTLGFVPRTIPERNANALRTFVKSGPISAHRADARSRPAARCYKRQVLQLAASVTDTAVYENADECGLITRATAKDTELRKTIQSLKATVIQLQPAFELVVVCDGACSVYHAVQSALAVILIFLGCAVGRASRGIRDGINSYL